MKNNIIKILSIILLIVIALYNNYYFTGMYCYDEIWNYGFGYNILTGLIPYKDFNMVITPLFPYILSFILKIFGSKLIVYHIFIAFIIVSITYLAYTKIGIYSILIYISLLIFSSNGYNTISLLWLFIILKLLDKDDNKYNDIVIPIIISIMILTKQTLILLVIPSLILSENKKKIILIYLSSLLLFIIYLLINNNIYEFFNYTILGLFDFASNNTSINLLYLILEIVIIITLTSILINSKFKDKKVFYACFYQIMCFPIVEVYHFVLGLSAFIYVLFDYLKDKDVLKNTLFIVLLIIELYILFTTNIMYMLLGNNYYELYKEDTFLKGRKVLNVTDDYIDKIEEIIDKYPDYRLYILNGSSYLVKLNLNIPINKYDLINNGNMGYKGSIKYINEIDKYCKNNKCLFIINDNDLDDKTIQTNKDILMYVVKNNNKIYSSTIFNAYINEKVGIE